MPCSTSVTSHSVQGKQRRPRVEQKHVCFETAAETVAVTLWAVLLPDQVRCFSTLELLLALNSLPQQLAALKVGAMQYWAQHHVQY